MEFIDYTINWTKGEIQEALIMGFIGLVITISAFLFWCFGNTANAKAMFWPILIVGIIPFFMSFSGVYTNKKRIIEYQKEYKSNPVFFAKAEKIRVENFDKIFKITYPTALIMLITGAVLFVLLSSPIWKSISLALIILGLMTFFIDHFAEERARIYLEEIDKFLNKL
ncbi:MAG: hypothetical protein N4A49_02345 [Marinifilaceae bacterium]|jgi:membrane-associated HD superfamily phosphohydrolase|nr:hypothetical protein [Marinifilaceae bacterium]